MHKPAVLILHLSLSGGRADWSEGGGDTAVGRTSTGTMNQDDEVPPLVPAERAESGAGSHGDDDVENGVARDDADAGVAVAPLASAGSNAPGRRRRRPGDAQRPAFRWTSASRRAFTVEACVLGLHAQTTTAVSISAALVERQTDEQDWWGEFKAPTDACLSETLKELREFDSTWVSSPSVPTTHAPLSPSRAGVWRPDWRVHHAEWEASNVGRVRKGRNVPPPVQRENFVRLELIRKKKRAKRKIGNTNGTLSGL